MARYKKRNTLIDLSRVIGPEPLSHLGNLMIRHPQYFRGIFLLLTTSAVHNNNYTRATVSIIILFSIRAIGMLLKFGPALLMNRVKKTAYLAGHRFNIAQKRRSTMRHTRLIWDYVYEPEVRTLYLPEEIDEQNQRDEQLSATLNENLEALPAGARREIGLTPGTQEGISQAIQQTRPVSCGVEKTYPSFYTSLMHALQTDYDRISQNMATGLYVNALEDYMCSPILGEHDAFPSQNWAGNQTLSSLRDRAEHYVLPPHARFNPDLSPILIPLRNMHRNLWHTLVTNVITKRTGTAIRKLNKLCRSHEISVQTLLWAECSDAAWIQQYPGLRDAIIAVRQRILCQAFGETSIRAEIMIERLTRSDELVAMHLRARCDYLYCNLSEAVNLHADYSELGDYSQDLAEIRCFMDEATGQLDEFRSWLKARSDQWTQQLTLSPRDQIRSIARFMRRFQHYIRTHAAEQEELIEEHGAKLEPLLLFYNHDDDLFQAGIPEPLIKLIHQYAKSLNAAASDLFAIENASALHAALTAFHANFDHVRTRFYALQQQPEPTAEEEFKESLNRILLEHSEIGTELIELRIHHAICKIQRLLYTEFVQNLRDPGHPSRRDRIRQRIGTLYNYKLKK